MNKKLFTDIFLGFVLFSIIVGSYIYSKNHSTYSPLQTSYSTTKGDKNFKELLTTKYTLLYFGFLTCPEACPTTLNKIKASFSELSPEEKSNFQLIFTGLDPERDTLLKIKTYLEYFNPEFVGVFVPQTQLEPLTANFGIVFKKVFQDNSNLSYTIDHSTDILVLDQSGKIIQTLHHELPKTAYVSELKKLIINK